MRGVNLKRSQHARGEREIIILREKKKREKRKRKSEEEKRTKEKKGMADSDRKRAELVIVRI